MIGLCNAFTVFEKRTESKENLEKRAGTFALKLGGSPILDGGAIAISKLVSTSLYLGMIDIASCGITDKGILALSRAIKANHENKGHLKCIFFDENHEVSTDANESIAHEIYRHRTCVVIITLITRETNKNTDHRYRHCSSIQTSSGEQKKRSTLFESRMIRDVKKRIRKKQSRQRWTIPQLVRNSSSCKSKCELLLPERLHVI